MKVIQFSLLFVLLFVSSSAMGKSVTIYENGNAGDFDFYLFVQQWIYSYCSQQTCISSKEREAFTIHGLWPENNDGSYPSFCNGPSFSSNQISDLLDTMDYDWPSLTGPNTDFWTHEWSKHGTCALTGPISDIHDYFSSALKLYETYNVTSALEQHNIYPSANGNVNINNVISILSNAYGGQPLIQCQDGQISTVTFCITKDLEVMDCPSLSGWTCGSSSANWPNSDNGDEDLISIKL